MRTRWKRRRLLAVTLPIALASCGGGQPNAPDAAVAAYEEPLPVAVSLYDGLPSLPPAPLVRYVRPENPNYAKLWEEALRRRPWPRVQHDPNAQTAPNESESSALQASLSNPLANAPQGDDGDPDPYHVLPPTLDIRVLAPYLTGVASWYGPTFHGKPTANGEIYNQYGLTAAHPVLPIGTKILVENLENHRRVWVRINDRGPYAKNRVLDLSKIAAQQLDMIENGTALVRITVLSWPDNVSPYLGLKAYTQYVVQAAAYPDIDEAEHLRERLQARFPQQPVFIDIASNGFFAVALGPFDDEPGARDLSRQMQRQGITNLVRRYRN
ncbi:MAG TPA: septal ring lytic transglycosylase RlpA family protein [bacterium]